MFMHLQQWRRHKESWTIKKDEHWRFDAFELCWRRILRVPWTARRSNQSALKEINTEYLLGGRMLKLQYFGHLMQKASSLEKTLMRGKIENRRRREWQRMRWLDGIRDSMDMNLRDFWKIVKEKESWYAAIQEFAKSQPWLGDWTMSINKVPKTVHDTKQMLKNIFN